MDDVSKSDGETPSEAIKDETVKDVHSEAKSQDEKTSKEQVKKKLELSKVKKNTQKETKKIKYEGKAERAEVKKETTGKEDFRYIVRIADTDINGEKKLVHGLASIKGIGLHISALIVNELDIDKSVKIGDLTDKQIDTIKDSLAIIAKKAPRWMLNHRKDSETGEDIHLIGSDIDMRLRDEINIMKKIRSYKGVRHERGLPVRGQRTRANNRVGLSLGVSKNREKGKK